MKKALAPQPASTENLTGLSGEMIRVEAQTLQYPAQQDLEQMEKQ